MLNSVLCSMLGLRYPIFQGGMAWIADGKLAAAVSNAGGLGIVAAGNAPADYVAAQIDAEVKKIIDAAYKRCEEILQRDREALVTVAEFLLRNETMSAEEFEKVFA